MFGLTDTDLQIIVDVVKTYPEIDQAIVFGSRAMGRERKTSDIDLALKGTNLTSVAPEVAGKLNEETPLPYFFDVLDYESIANQDLRDHIDRVGKTFYPPS